MSKRKGPAYRQRQKSKSRPIIAKPKPLDENTKKNDITPFQYDVNNLQVRPTFILPPVSIAWPPAITVYCPVPFHVMIDHVSFITQTSSGSNKVLGLVTLDQVVTSPIRWYPEGGGNTIEDFTSNLVDLYEHHVEPYSLRPFPRSKNLNRGGFDQVYHLRSGAFRLLFINADGRPHTVSARVKGSVRNDPNFSFDFIRGKIPDPSQKLSHLEIEI